MNRPPHTRQVTGSGRGKPLPYGDGYAWVRNVQRDVGDAVPYGVGAFRRTSGKGAAHAAQARFRRFFRQSTEQK